MEDLVIRASEEHRSRLPGRWSTWRSGRRTWPRSSIALRGDGCLIGEWLAEEQGAVEGFIAFARVEVETDGGTMLPRRC